MPSKVLGPDQLMEVLNALIDQIQTEVFQANAVGDIEAVYKKLGYPHLLTQSIPSYRYIDVRHSKILVIAFQMNIDMLRMTAKKMGFDVNRVEFLEYKSNFDFGSLRFSQKYSDVLVGPIPHMGCNIGDASSFLAAVLKDPQEFPKVQRLTSLNEELKVTKTAFKEALLHTQYYKEIIKDTLN